MGTPLEITSGYKFCKKYGYGPPQEASGPIAASSQGRSVQLSVKYIDDIKKIICSSHRSYGFLFNSFVHLTEVMAFSSIHLFISQKLCCCFSIRWLILRDMWDMIFFF